MGPIMTYIVTFETRKPGAIGAFYHSTVTVDASSIEQAYKVAMYYFHCYGLETRFPVFAEVTV